MSSSRIVWQLVLPGRGTPRELNHTFPFPQSIAAAAWPL